MRAILPLAIFGSVMCASGCNTPQPATASEPSGAFLSDYQVPDTPLVSHKSSAVIGPYQIVSDNDGIFVIGNRKKVNVGEYRTQCMPVLSPSGKRLFLALEPGTLACVAPGPRVAWVKGVSDFEGVENAFGYNPGLLVAMENRIVFDAGPLSINALRTKNPKEYLRSIDSFLRIIAADDSGKTKWNKPWTAVGTPLAEISNNEMLCLQVLNPGALNPLGRNEPLSHSLCIRDRDAHLIRAWRIPEPVIHKDMVQHKYTLANCLQDNVLWRVKQSRPGKVTITATQLEYYDGLSEQRQRGGFACAISIDGDDLTIRVTSPKKLVVYGRPMRRR